MTNPFPINGDSCYKSLIAMYKLSILTGYTRLSLTAALLAAFSFFMPAPASALSVHDWEAFQTEHQRSQYIGDFIEKFTAEIGTKNPSLCQAIRDWFVVKPAGAPSSEGITNLSAEVWALDNVAKEGRIDLTKIQLEGVIVKVIKEKFQPKAAAQK